MDFFNFLICFLCLCVKFLFIFLPILTRLISSLLDFGLIDFD